MAAKTNTFNVIFHLRKFLNATHDKLPVYARITIDSKRIELAVKQLIDPVNWNESRGMAKGNKEEFKILNKYLEQLRASYVECYREMVLNKRVITVETFKQTYFGKDDNEFTLCKLMNYHNQDMKETITWGTLKNYFTTQSMAEDGQKSR